MKPIQATFSAPIPDDVPFDVKPMGYDKPGYQIVYLVKGENISGIDEESLKIDMVRTKDGKDISKNFKGKPTYELGPFAKVADNGKYARFTVSIEPDKITQSEIPEVHGSISVSTAGGTEVKTVQLKTSGGEPQTAGQFTVSVAKAGGGMFGSDGFGITLKGPENVLSSIEVTSGGKACESEGTMTLNGVKTFYFEKPTAADVTVSLTCWTDLKSHVLTF